MTIKRSARMALLACASVAALGLIAGSSTAAAKTITKTATFNQCVNFGVPIVDANDTTDATTASVAQIPVTVPKFKGKPQDGLVTAFTSIGTRITHTDDGDLELFLVSPGGRVISLSHDNDDNSSGDGWGSGDPSCAGSLVLFGDAFPTSIKTPGNNTANQPITGSFKPEQPLAGLAGGPARGNWTFFVVDDASADTGSINAVSLNFTYQYKALKKKKKHKK